jgi:ribosomal protein S18 acetylase RimI-like enzyme
LRPIDHGLLVRPATDEDFDAVMVLLQDCVAYMRGEGIDQWDEIYPSGETIHADTRTGTMYLGFLDRETLIGALVLNEFQNAEWSQATWTITGVPIVVVHRLMVNPKHQGRGIARDLMRFAERWAVAHEYGAIRLGAFSANPRALRLYHGLGYRDAGGASLRKGPFRCFEKSLHISAG